MSMEWWERVPKSNREAELAKMNEGKYLGILRRAALRKLEGEQANALQQSELAKALHTKSTNLRDMESGHKRAPLAVCKLYCERLGIPITVMKRVGNGSLLWDGDTPSDPQPQAEPAPAPKKKRRSSNKATLTEEEKERQQKLRAERRVTDGAQLAVSMEKASGLRLRNHIEYNLVVVVGQTDKGTLTVDIFDEGADTTPAELLKNGFTGVRIPLPQVVTYDFDRKKKVHETNVPTHDP